MADKKISTLTAQTVLDGTEQVEVLVGGTNKRMAFGLGYVRGAPEQTASFTAAPFFEYPLDTTSATPIVQTLPAAPPDGTLISGKWTKGANATATAVCSGTDHFNTSTGATSVAYEYLNTKYDFLYVASLGVWLVETSFSKGGLQLFLQPLDSDLTAIAALATTTYGRSLLTLAAQTNLASALAVDAAFTTAFQPLDSDLTAIAALATTSYGRGLLTSATQSALATLLAADAAFTSIFAPLPTALVSGRYYRVPNATLTTSNTSGNGSARACRKYIPSAITISRIGAEVTVIGDAGSHIRLGIWNDSNGRPGTLLLDAGQIAADSATVQEITISQALGPGWYWFGGALQDETTVQATIRFVSSITEPHVIDLGTATPGAGATAEAAFYGGATAAFAGSWGTYAGISNAPSIFVKVA